MPILVVFIAMSDSRLYWIGFNLVKGIGAVRFQALLNAFGDAQSAWQASPADLREAGLSPRIVENLVRLRAGVSLEKVWENIQKAKINVLTWEDEAYPRRLKEIDQPPPVLYLSGEIKMEDEWAVAIVGTRRMTPYGRQVAEEIASVLAGNGITIVSGLAKGIDAVAHQAALNTGGRTLAVLGSGVDRVYPYEHRRLAEKISAQGALVSDYPPGTAPEASNFPPRNRIIAGLSLATVVVEAGLDSGALITATFAVEQGREVFAVPGNITASQSQGTNRLIRDGAHPLLDAQDILEVLNLTQVTEQREARAVLPTDPDEASIYRVLGREPTHIDEIRNQTDMPIDKVSATLALMELKGMVRQVGGMHYVAVREQPEDYQV